jgi:DNA-binding beta-propeller fold protein YncE
VRARVAGAFAAFLLAAACNSIVGNSDGVYVRPGSIVDGGGPDALLEGYTLVVVSGQGQSGEVGKELSQAVAVEARDPQGKPATGMSLRFVASQGGGYFVDPTGPAADGQGRAQARYVLGPAAKNVIDVTLEGTTAKASLEATSTNPWQLSIRAGLRVGRMMRDGKGADARFEMLRGVAVAQDGNVYIADEYANILRRFDPRTTDVVTVAGKFGEVGRVEGAGEVARFTGLQSVAVEQGGRLIIGGWATQSIHRFDTATTQVSIVAGSGISGAKDDVGVRAQFQYPRGVAIDNVGKRAFVADQYNNAIRQVDLATGTVTTLAGVAGAKGAGVDDIGAAARFNAPIDVAFDGDHTLFVADYANVAIRAIDVNTKAVSTIAGKLGTQAFVDGAGVTTARFMGPHYLAYDPNVHVLYVTDVNAGSIRRVSIPDTGESEVTTIVGSPPPTIIKGVVDAVGNDARVLYPSGLALTPNGDTLYIGDSNATLRRMDVASRMVETVAGASSLTRNGNAATEAVFDGPRGLANGPNGSVIVADIFGHVMRTIDGDTVSTLAGSADEASGGTEGPGPVARFNLPMTATSDGTYVYITEAGHTIRRVALSDGTTKTLAGERGTSGYVDAAGASARFNAPAGLAIDAAAQELYVADTQNHRIRVVNLKDPFVVETRAGGNVGAVDGNLAQARFNAPSGLALANGMLYVADAQNHAVRRIEIASGMVTTFAGTLGKAGFEDGPAEKARFNYPYQVAVDGDLLYVTDLSNAAIRRIHIPTRTVSTFLGGVGPGFGTGALPQPLTQAAFLLIRPGGEVLFTERVENVVFRVGP